VNREDLHSEILKDIRHRESWETRQRIWYEMRHDGLRRRNKEDWMSDLHHPLADTIIGKLKPYFFEQLFSTDTLATFLSLNPDTRQAASQAAQWHDFKVKQHSNCETEILSVIDHMLMSGRSVIKITWDPGKKQVVHESIDPTRVVVPYGTKDLDSTDRFVHVINISAEAYRRNANYDQSLLDKISGKGTDEQGENVELRQERELREGITHTEQADRVILWEAYIRKDGKWFVHTFAPTLPEKDVRAPFELPYEFDGLPFVDFPAEIKDSGWYSPRGVVEMVAPFETSLTKTWNEKLDSMTLYNRPLFYSEDVDRATAANIRMTPGQILPFKIDSVNRGNPPVSWDQEMVSTRMVAEQRAAIPDFGIGQNINTSDRKTATEVNALSQMMGNVGDLRMRVFRKSLARMYQMQWSLLTQYDKASLDFIYQNNLGQVPKEALHKDYTIAPSGSLDGVNKAYLLQKAVTRLQMFSNDPFVEQYELRKSVMELDDPSLVSRMLVDPGQRQMDQAEEQALEITVLRTGFPVRVKQTDDHEVHIQTITQFLEAQGQMQTPVEPVAVQRIMEHLEQHVQAIEEEDGKHGREVRNNLQALAQEGEPQGLPEGIPTGQPGQGQE
jgi:hypothetical protein